MSDILDEHLLRRQRRKNFLCKRFRTITLVFAAVMLLLYFVSGQLFWRGGEYFLGAGLLSIVLQTIGCYAAKENRSIGDTIRVIIMVGFTLFMLRSRGII